MQLRTIAAQLTLLLLLQSYCTAQTARAQDAFAVPTLAPRVENLDCVLSPTPRSDKNSAAREPDQTKKALDSKNSHLDLQLFQIKIPTSIDGPCMVYLQPSSTSDGGWIYPLEIDQEPLRGLTNGEVARLLLAPGPHLSKIQISYLTEAGTFKTIRLERTRFEPLVDTTVPGQQLEQFFNSLDQKALLDYQAYNTKSPEELVGVNLDIFAKAEILNRYKRIASLPEPKYIVAGIESTQDAKAAAIMGDMAQTSTLQKQLLSVMQQPLYLSRSDAPYTDQAWQALLNADTDCNVIDLLDRFTSAARNAKPQADIQEYSLAQELIVKAHTLALTTLALDGSAKAMTLAKELYHYRLPPGMRRSLGQERLGDALAAGHEYRLALNCYNEAFGPSSNDHNFWTVAQHARIKYKIATTMAASGNCTGAKTMLQDAIKLWQNDVNAQISLELEKTNGFFPTISDLECALAKIALQSKDFNLATSSASRALQIQRNTLGTNHPYSKETLKLLAASYEAQGKTIQAREATQHKMSLPEAEQRQDFDQHYRYDLIKQVLKCSKNKDKNGTAIALAKLTKIYDGEPGYGTSDQNQLNMFCALLNIARKLSDNDMLSESSKLLTQLDRAAGGKELTPAAQSLVRAEQIINQARMTAKQANPVTIETQSLFVVPEMMALSRIDQLRSMGLVYFYAHEYERATVFYDLASQAAPTLDKDKYIDSRIRLLLDKACLKATLSDFKSTDDLVHQALPMLPDSNLAKANSASLNIDIPCATYDKNPSEREKARQQKEMEDRAFALAESKRLYAKKTIISKMAELAEIYKQHHKSEAAIDYLKQVAAIAKAKMPDKKEDTFDYDASDSLLQATLAQLYESINKPELALSLYSYAVDSAADRSGAMLFLQYADCAARLGKHKLAANNYATFLERAYSLPHNVVDRQPDWRISYLRKAYNESLQAPDSDKTKQEALGESLVNELQGQYPVSKELIEIYKTLIDNSTDELRKYHWRVSITMKELQMKNDGSL